MATIFDGLQDSVKPLLGNGNGSKNYAFEASYTRKFQVLSSLDADSEDVFLYMGSTYNYNVGVAYPNNPYAYLTSMTAEATDVVSIGEYGVSGLKWIVTYEYGPLSKEIRISYGNPINMPYRLSWSGANYEEAIVKDFTTDSLGNPTPKQIINSAKDPIDPPLMRLVGYSMLRVQRNEQYYDETLMAQYRFKVNAADWTVYDPRTGQTYTIPARSAQCLGIEGQPEYSQVLEVLDTPDHNGQYTVVNYEFAIKILSWDNGTDDKGQGWDRRVLNAGYNQLVDSSGTTVKERILDPTGLPYGSPVPLDSAGAALDPNASSFTPTYRTFRVYEEADFTEFNFGAP